MRNHAFILTSIWNDPDFRQLDSEAQRVYLMLLSQAKLSMAGAIDYMPDRWAGYSANTTVADIEATIARLEASRYVFVDRSERELVIRTVVKHDPARGFKSRIAMWNAWGMIQSERLRHALTHQMPADMWTDDRSPAPEMALQMRDTPLQEGSTGGTCDTPSDAPSDTPCQGGAVPPATATYHQPPPPAIALTVESEPTPTAVKPMAPSGAATRTARKPNPLWDALTAEFGEAQTSGEQSLRGRIVKSLATAGAEPSDIAVRAREHRRRWPNVSCTETSLDKHWTKLATPEINPVVAKGTQALINVAARRGEHPEPPADSPMERARQAGLRAIGSGQ